MHLTRGSWTAFLAAMALYCAWLVALGGPAHGFLDPATSYVSELSAVGQPHRGFFRLADALTGLIVLVIALRHGRRVLSLDIDPERCTRCEQWILRLRRLALAGLVLFGAATMLDALWSFSCLPTQDPSCAARENAGTVPWRHQAHTVTSTLTGLGMTAVLIAQPLSELLTLRVARSRGESPEVLRPLARRAAVVVILAVLATVFLIISILLGPPFAESYGAGPLPLGWVQRVSLLCAVLAMAVSFAPGRLSTPAPAHEPGPPAVDIHPGLGVAMDTFDGVRRHLGPLHVLAFPRAGMDGAPSRPHGQVPGAVADAELLRRSLETAGPGGSRVHRVVLVGHSMAGPVIETFARLNPDRVAGLVFLDASIPPSGGRSKGVRRDKVAAAVRRAWSRRPLTRALSRFTAFSERLTNVDVENAAYPWYIEETTRVRNKARLPNIPVEVVVATLGLPFTGYWVRQQRDFVRLLRATGAPHARLHVIRPSGHIVQKHHPKAVAEIIRRAAGLD